MGTQRLKIKNQLNYRRGSTHKHCSDCNHYLTMPIKGIGGEDLGIQPRCKIIGTKPGRMYRVHPENICDAFDGSKKLYMLRPAWLVSKND